MTDYFIEVAPRHFIPNPAYRRPQALRGPVPNDGGARRQQRRRYALKHIGLDPETLPSILKQLVLEHHGRLEAVDRRRLARALLARGLGAGQVGLVLNLLGDDPLNDDQLFAFVAEREIEQRPCENLSVLTVRKRVGRRGHGTSVPHYLIGLQLDARPDDHIVLALQVRDLAGVGRFRGQCIRQADFTPVFKDETPQGFHRFVDGLLRMVPEDERA